MGNRRPDFGLRASAVTYVRFGFGALGTTNPSRGWYNDNAKEYPPFVSAAVVHNQFETIHPFQDGNGRVGRLLLINALIKHGLPPLNIELKNRKQYYEALREYQTNGNLRPMLDLMLEEHRRLKAALKR